MSDIESINVEDVEIEDTIISAAEKLKESCRRRRKRPKRCGKLGLYQSRKIATKEKKKLRKNKNDRKKSSLGETSAGADINYEEPVGNFSYCKHNDTATTIGYENVDEMECNEAEYFDIDDDDDDDDDDCSIHGDHNVTDACMSAMSHSFAAYSEVKDEVKLCAGNVQGTANKNVQTSPAQINSTRSFEDEDDTVTFKERSIRKLTNKAFIEPLVDKLDENGCLVDFVRLLTVLANGTLANQNIPLLLLLDLAKFVSLENTSGMKYREETRKFWTAIYKFGGGAVIRLLSGLKHFAQVCVDKCKKGFYNPVKGEFNFAVPDIKTLRTKNVKKIPPGFIYENIRKVDRSKQYNLAVDGKKVGPGCGDINEGDINLLGLEGPPTLAQQNHRLNTEISLLDDLIAGESTDDMNYSNQVDNLPLLLRKTSRRIKDMRITQVKNERLRNSFQKSMTKDPSQYKKCNFAISSINIYEFFSSALIDKILYCNKQLCNIMSKIQGTNHLFNLSRHVDLEEQGNACVLLPPDMINIPDDEELYPHYIKQGTDEWKEQRKLSFITGSSMYKGLGLSTLKEQREHYKTYVSKEEQVISPELQRRFDHGHECETHAFGTLAGVFLPAYFPECKKITEMGCMFLDGHKREKLMEISPDALITSSPETQDCIDGKHGDEYDIVVEIKSPMGEKKDVLPVHYTVPKYYVPQVLAEMKVLGLKMGFYVSYSKQSMTILSVQFDEELWNELWSLALQYYDDVTPERITRVSEKRPEIQSKITEFIKSKCALIVEIPSSTASLGDLEKHRSNEPYRIGRCAGKLHSSIPETKEELLQVCEKLKSLIKEVYEMERNKATEILMFVLNDTDRMYSDRSTSAIPIAYAMKGYSLDVETMRKLVDIVRDKLKEENIDVICESYDGQWCNLAFKGHYSKPLTKLQLQRNVWSKLGRISKENLLRILDSWTRTTIEEKDLWSTSRFLTVGQNTIGKLSVEFDVKSRNDGKKVLKVQNTGGNCSIRSPMTKIHTPRMKDRPDIWFPQEDDVEEDSNMIKFTDPNLNVLNLLPPDFVQSDTLESAVRDVAENAIAQGAVAQYDENQLPDIPQAQQTYTGDRIGHVLVDVNPIILEQILVGLCSERRGMKWSTFTVQKLYDEILSSQKQIEHLTSYEMDVVDNVFYGYLKKHLFNTSDLKATKVKAICKLFGRKRQLHTYRGTNTKNVTLRRLCCDVIKDIDYPTNALAVAIANMYHIVAKQRWISSSTKPLQIRLPSNRVHNCFSYPEYVSSRRQIESKILDYTHILTNVRTHLCNKGYKKVKKDAFLKVSQVDNSVLNRAFVVDILDKQSAAIALKFFTERVEEIMLDNGYINEALFVKLFRNWHNAVDERGISVSQRLEYLQDMADYLSKLTNFDVYPPQKQYILGIPITTYECLMQNITTRIQLYSCAKQNMYNHRSISTLSVESLFSHLSRMHGTYNGCPRAVDVSRMLQTMVQMDELLKDPNKKFTIDVSNKKKYPENKLMSESDIDSSDDEATLNFRSHKFDRDVTRTRKKKVRNVELTSGNKPMKRIEPVRIVGNFKIREGNIKSTTRHGLPD